MSDDDVQVTPGHAFVAALTSRSRAAFAGCCAVDVQYEDPLSHGAREGLDPLGDHVARLWAMVPDARIVATSPPLDGAGGLVAHALRLDGTHVGRLADLPATKQRLSVHAMLVLEIRAGHVHRARAFYDPWDAGIQLGLLPKRGTVRSRALLALSGWGLTRR